MAQVVRFDCFEVDLSLGQVRKRNTRVHLREQSFQVLAALLERPGELVTRDALRRRLWGDDVFVDFDNNLNIAVARLREALGDSATDSRFVETIPKRGYRFVGRVGGAAITGVTPSARPRLLVLPLDNASRDPAQDWLCDAMTDEMISTLASLASARLAVIARTTTMHYKGTRKDVGRIGREVRVDYIAEGALHVTGERVSINMQLVKTSDQAHVFARRYEAALADIFDLQARIAHEFVGHIARTVTPFPGQEQAARKPTENPGAYTEYIKGRYEMWKWTPDGVARARQHFEAALACDPRFALACDGLANLYGYLGLWGFLPPDHAEPLRWFYGVRATELDPMLVEPRTHVAYHPEKTRYEDAYSYNWVEAEREMAAARDLNPDSPLIRVRHSTVLLVLGRLDEALTELRCALEFDPLSPEVAFWLGWVLFLARDHEQALVHAHRLVDLAPDQPFSHMVLGIVHLGMKRYEDSVGALRHAAKLSNDFPLVLGWLGLPLGLSGFTAEARSVLEHLRAIAKEGFVLPTSFAWTHLGLGEVDEAFAWMEQAAHHNDEWIHPLRTYPFLDPLRRDPRFRGLLETLSLAD